MSSLPPIWLFVTSSAHKCPSASSSVKFTLECVSCRDGVVLPARLVVRWLCGARLQPPALHRLLPGGPPAAGPVHEEPLKGHAEGGHQRPHWPNGQNALARCLVISMTSEGTCPCPCVRVRKGTLNQHWLMLEVLLMYAVLSSKAHVPKAKSAFP